MSAAEVAVLTWQICTGTSYAAAAAISRAVPQSSAAAGTPGRLSFSETSPSCMTHFFARNKSSQCAVTRMWSFGASHNAFTRQAVSMTGRPSSLKAMAPASCSASKSHSSSPFSPYVIAAAT